MPFKSTTVAQRFQKYATKNADSRGCILWVGARDDWGYGRLAVGDRKYERAHRVAWVLKSGRDIPDGLFVLHSCDNPPCVNPSHLFLGTNADNMRDKTNKGRQAKGLEQSLACRNHPSLRGEKCSSAKLSLSQVEKIKSMYATGEYFQREIADVFGCAQTLVSQIVNGKIWNLTHQNPIRKSQRKFGGVR